MKWVTRSFVHLDRVASPWAIKRFIDREAEFVFVEWGEEHTLPPDAISFAIAGGQIGPHDAEGTTFEKLLRKYELQEPPLWSIARIVRAGVDSVLHGRKPSPDDTCGLMADGLLAIAEGMMLLHNDDNVIIEASLPVYDALYANFRAHHLLQSRGLKLPASENKGPVLPTLFLRKLLSEA